MSYSQLPNSLRDRSFFLSNLLKLEKATSPNDYSVVKSLCTDIDLSGAMPPYQSLSRWHVGFWCDNARLRLLGHPGLQAVPVCLSGCWVHAGWY
jgi:hypothetical protein